MLILAVMVLGVAVVVLLARVRAGTREPGQPDAVTEDVFTGLLAELRKWQAEAEHWKSTAERLQRELDQR